MNNNLNYNRSSGNIKKRAEKMSGKINKVNMSEDSKTEVRSIIKNQEENISEYIPLNEQNPMNEEAPLRTLKPPIAKPETITEIPETVNPAPPTPPSSNKNIIWAFIDKYKIWLIIGLVIIILLVIAIAFFSMADGTVPSATIGGNSPTVLDDIGVSTPSQFSMATPSPIKEIKESLKKIPEFPTEGQLTSAAATDMDLSTIATDITAVARPVEIPAAVASEALVAPDVPITGIEATAAPIDSVTSAAASDLLV